MSIPVARVSFFDLLPAARPLADELRGFYIEYQRSNTMWDDDAGMKDDDNDADDDGRGGVDAAEDDGAGDDDDDGGDAEYADNHNDEKTATSVVVSPRKW